MLQPKLFRREPTEIRAIQFNGENESAIQDFVGIAPEPAIMQATQAGLSIAGLSRDRGFYVRHDAAMGKTEGALWVSANQTWLPIQIGEWIAQDEHGFYPIKDNGGKPFNYVEANKYSPGQVIFG